MINGTQAVEYTTYIGRVAAPSRLEAAAVPAKEGARISVQLAN
jgi:hypothetical protein